MKKYETIDAFFSNRGPEDIQRFVDKNLDISQQVYALLEEKGWTQKEFAKQLGKKEAEISKWLSGNHNLTLRSIAKMEAVLEEEIILTPQKASKKYSKIEYVTFKFFAHSNELVTNQDQKGYQSYEEKAELTSESQVLKIA